jgi:hypothetical protein
VPDRPHQGDFDNPRIMLGSAPPGGLQTIYNLEAGSAPSRGHQQSLSARKGPLRGARSCPTCWGSPVRSALSLTLTTHYPPLPIPELSSRDICSRPNEAGEKRAIQPVRPSSKTLSSFRTKLRITGRPRSLPPSWRRRRAPEPPSRKPSSSPSCPDSRSSPRIQPGGCFLCLGPPRTEARAPSMRND